MSHMKLKDGMDKWIVCRICLDQPSTDLESIFHQNDEKDLTLLIQECGGVPIKKFDHYPDKICTKCLKNLKSAFTFRKICQHSHERLSRLIAPTDVDSGEQQKISYVEEYTIEKLELKFEPKDVKAELETEMVLDMSNVCDDETEKYVPEHRNITKLATIEVSKSTGSTSMYSKNQQISNVEKDDAKNPELGVIIKEEISETEMISEAFHVFDEGAEEFMTENANKNYLDMNYKKLDVKMELEEDQKIYENEMILGNAFEDVDGKFIEEDKTEKATSSSHKVKGSSNIQISDDTTDDEFLPSTEKSFHCDVCGLTFAQNQDYMQHMQIHKIECKTCGRFFASYRYLKKHSRTHTDERPHNCDICGKTFTQKAELKKHLIGVHKIIDFDSSIENHRCEICERTFIHKTLLVYHMRTHTGERSHKCEVCERTFVVKSQYTRHMTTHTGERPYKCSYCPKAFAYVGTLNLHHRTHTNPRPFSCDICGKSFATNYVAKHKRTFHGINHKSEKTNTNIEPKS